MSALLKPHNAEVRPHAGGHLEIYCSGCGMSKTRNNEKAAAMVANHHATLNASQFKGYQQPPRGSEGESSN